MSFVPIDESPGWGAATSSDDVIKDALKKEKLVRCEGSIVAPIVIYSR